MRWRELVLIIFILFIIIGGVIIFLGSKPKSTSPPQGIATTAREIKSNMKLISSAFAHNQSIPSKYTCDGENVNPPLAVSEVPPEAKSLVLIVDDPDAPMGTWVHWTVWNIDPKTKEIAENTTPSEAVEGKTDFGTPGYGGPCPPSGTHRYFFKLYALDKTLSFSLSALKRDLEKAMEGHILDKTELIGLYRRQ